MSAATHHSIRVGGSRVGGSRSIPLSTGGAGRPPGDHDEHDRGLEDSPFDELEIQLVSLSSQLRRLEAVVILMEADLAEQQGISAGLPRADPAGPARDEPNGRAGAPPTAVPAQRRAAGAGGPPPRVRRDSGRGRRANRRRRR